MARESVHFEIFEDSHAVLMLPHHIHHLAAIASLSTGRRPIKPDSRAVVPQRARSECPQSLGALACPATALHCEGQSPLKPTQNVRDLVIRTIAPPGALVGDVGVWEVM